MNWGHKIIIVFIVFAAGILTLVIKSINTKIDMVTPDYYGEELKYQCIIDGKQNAGILSSPVMIAQPEEGILITFPQELWKQQLTGNVTFYRPSDSQKDINLPLHPDKQGNQLVGKNLFIRGLYKVKLQWTIHDKPFYQEQFLNIY